MPTREPTSAAQRRRSRQVVPAVRPEAGDIGPRARRTVDRILDATREVFMTKGYFGTTIDEIAQAAGVSRASFYTYFPTRRDVLLAVGSNAAGEMQVLIDAYPEYGATRAGVRQWLALCIEQLDRNGPFAMAWPVAAMNDEEIRRAGMRRQSVLSRNLGRAILASGGRTIEDPEPVGLVVMAMMERVWRYGELYREAVDRDAVIAQMANAVWGLARQPAH